MSPRSLKLLASAIVILNLFDAIFTLTYTESGLATESNPMMHGPLAASPTMFILAKITLVSLCVLLLSRVGPRKAALVALVGATTAYTGIVLYHLSAVPLLVASL